jgi:hypothetical protein
MSTWFAGFANRITLGWMAFLTASAALLVAAVGSRTLRSARSNPLDSLRYDGGAFFAQAADHSGK